MLNGLFKGCTCLEWINLNVRSLQNMDEMFMDTKRVHINAKALGTDSTQDNKNFPHVTSARAAWKNSKITELNGFKMPLLANADEMCYNCKKLQFVTNCEFGELKSATSMYYKCINLISDTSSYPMLEDGSSMYNGLTKLTIVPQTFPSLINGSNMFNGCKSLNNNSFTSDSFPNLENGFAMFSSTGLTSIPSSFPHVTNARQMFDMCSGISGHLDIDMPRMFPSIEDGDGDTNRVAYMFGECPITSISFDLSNVSNAVSMFWGCTQIRRCTGAVFKENGNYQSMLDFACFDRTSAEIILDAAIRAHVAALHIGMNTVYRTDDFREQYNFQQLEEGIDKQWIIPDSKIVVKWN